MTTYHVAVRYTLSPEAIKQEFIWRGVRLHGAQTKSVTLEMPEWRAGDLYDCLQASKSRVLDIGEIGTDDPGAQDIFRALDTWSALKSSAIQERIDALCASDSPVDREVGKLARLGKVAKSDGY